MLFNETNKGGVENMEKDKQMTFDDIAFQHDTDDMESLCRQLSKMDSGTKLLLKNQIELILENKKLSQRFADAAAVSLARSNALQTQKKDK